MTVFFFICVDSVAILVIWQIYETLSVPFKQFNRHFVRHQPTHAIDKLLLIGYNTEQVRWKSILCVSVC